MTGLNRLKALGALCGAAAICAWLAGCGSANAPPAIASKPDVIVTVDGVRHACVVALYSEEQGSAIPCDDVVRFVKEELKVPSGSIYDLRTVPTVDAAQKDAVDAGLKSAGYRFIGGHS